MNQQICDLLYLHIEQNYLQAKQKEKEEKRRKELEQLAYEAFIESEHSDWGDRD